MASRPQTRGEKLSRDNESGGVWSKIGEEECERVENEKRDVVAATVLAVAAGLAPEIVVNVSDDEHEERHEEEAGELDDPTADYVDQGDSEPVAWNSGAKRDQGLSSGHLENLLQGAHGLLGGQPPHGCEDVLLEKVLTVESYVKEEPGARAAQKLNTVSLQEFP